MATFPAGRSFVRAACDAVTKAGSFPVDMSYFAAREESAADYCRRRVRECDVYLGIIGFRYGSFASGDFSYTELEFDEATRAAKPRLLFLLDEDAPIPRSIVDLDGRAVQRFREKAASGNVVSFFSSADGLESAVLHALHELGRDNGNGYGALVSSGRGKSSRPWTVPHVGTVIDRDELIAPLMEQLLAPGGGSVSVSTAVEGTGGFGKTTLAAVACSHSDVRRRYPGGLVWTTVGESASGAELAGLVNDVCEALTGLRPSTSEPMLAAARLGEALDDREDTLLVLDDVWTAQQLAPFLIGGPGCRRLVTTRNRGILPPGTRSVVVDAMTPDQAARTLRLGLDGLTEGSAARLLALTGRWPVLLGLVNAAVVDRVADGAPVGQAARWVADRLASDGPTALDITDGYTRGRAVAATIEVSLERLSNPERNQYAKLAILPEDVDVPAEILALLWDSDEFVGERRAEDLRDRLVRLRLVIGRWTDGQPAIRLHDVIRDYLRRRLSPIDLQAAHRRFVENARRLLPADARAGWWTLPTRPSYLWRFLPLHLREAGHSQELLGLLEDLRWTAAKTEIFETIVPVEADLSLADSPVVRKLRRAAAQNSHVLTPLHPGDGLGPTLVSRLETVEELEPIVSAFAARLPRPYLRSRWPIPDLPPASTRRVLSGHASWVTACAFSPAGDLLASGSEDATVRLWRTDTWEPSAVLAGHSGPVRDCTFTSDGDFLISVGDDHTVRLWDVTSTTHRVLEAGHTAEVVACAISPGRGRVTSASADGSVRLTDIKSGRLLQVFDGHTGGATACAVTTDGGTVAVGSSDQTIRLRDSSTGTLRQALNVGSPITSCAFSPDDRLLAVTTTDGAAALFTVPDLRLHADLGRHYKRARSCAFTPDGRVLATTGDDNTVRTWDVESGAELITFARQPGWVRDCSFSWDGAYLASAGADQIRIWDLSRTGQEQGAEGHRGWVRGCAVSPDRKQLATGGDDALIRIWEIAEGRCTLLLRGHMGDVNGCAISPEGTYLASAGDDASVRLWDLPTGQPSGVLEGHGGRVKCCAFSPDGRWIVSGSGDRTARVWNVRSGQTHAVLRGHHEEVNACRFSPDGKMIATASADHTVRLWDSNTTEQVRLLTGHEEWVNSCAFTADGRSLITASGDGTLRIWELPDGRCSRILSGHSHWVRGCDLSPNQRWIASTSRDRTVRIWDRATGACVTALRVGARLATCCWTSNTTIAIAGDAGVYQLALVQPENTPAR